MPVTTDTTTLSSVAVPGLMTKVLPALIPIASVRTIVVEFVTLLKVVSSTLVGRAITVIAPVNIVAMTTKTSMINLNLFILFPSIFIAFSMAFIKTLIAAHPLSSLNLSNT